jgi:hypothetical protein
MDVRSLERNFSKMGAAVEFENSRERPRFVWTLQLFRTNPKKFAEPPKLPKPTLDVVQKGKDEVFVIDTFDNPKMNVEVIEVRPKARHLLLMIKDQESGEVSKYLCGHDERHWFVAAIPESAGAKNVADAMEALKPALAHESQARRSVKAKHKNKRKNDGYTRQGEWFFIPAPDLKVPDNAIHKREPIVRGRRAKPHIVEELYRLGGREVFVHPKHAPNGISPAEFEKRKRQAQESGRKPTRDDRDWRRMVADATAYARGYVRHSDHKTIHLNGWHRVEMNLEHKAKAMEWVRFLD